jgi:hypothetical protein
MTLPDFARIMPFIARRASRMEPARFVWSTESMSSSDMRMSSVSRVMPAFATRTATGPKRSSISA